MGLADLILGSQNPFAQFVASNKNTIHGLGAGLASGQNFSQGLSNAAQQGLAGNAADDAYAVAQKAEADRQAAIQQQSALRQKYAAFFQQQNQPVYAQFVADGVMDPGQAYGDWQKSVSPNADPTSTVAGRTQLAQQYGLSPEDTKAFVLTSKLPDALRSQSTPSGYQWGSDGKSLSPIPGGPADPASAQGLTPESLDLIASQYLAGDKSAITGYARNANMRAQIANAVATMANERGMDGKAIAAEVSAYGGNVAAQRSAGTRAAQVGMAASEANQMADIALEASAKVPRGALVPWNAAMNAVATGTSSPEMAAFVTATTSLVNAYARAVSPLGAPTDAMRQHAEQMLNTAQGPEAYKAVIAQMKNEMQAALNAPAEVSERLKQGVTGAGQQSVSGDLSTMSDADLLNALNN